jgi:hypothetical protein
VSPGSAVGLSPLDWHAHAIDEYADHPDGVYLAPVVRHRNRTDDDQASDLARGVGRIAEPNILKGPIARDLVDRNGGDVLRGRAPCRVRGANRR